MISLAFFVSLLFLYSLLSGRIGLYARKTTSLAADAPEHRDAR
jgi:hypothetical protein